MEVRFELAWGTSTPNPLSPQAGRRGIFPLARNGRADRLAPGASFAGSSRLRIKRQIHYLPKFRQPGWLAAYKQEKTNPICFLTPPEAAYSALPAA